MAPINFVIDGENICVEKSLLTDHSQYFQAMFQNHFQENLDKEIELKSVDFDSFKNVISVASEEIQVSEVADDSLSEMFHCSNMLQFEEVQLQCGRELTKRLTPANCWSILALADLTSDTQLLKNCEIFILSNFMKTLTDVGPDFFSLSSGWLVKLLSSPILNVSSELKVVHALEMWTEGNDCQDKLKMMVSQCVFVDELSPDEAEILKKKNCFPPTQTDDASPRKPKKRKLPTLPCVVAFSSDETQLEIMGWCSQSKSLVSIANLADVPSFKGVNVKDIRGFKISCSGTELVLTGGEFRLGHSNWNRDVMVWDSREKVWNKLTTLQDSRRHHSALIVDNKIYLFGGFGKYRVILNTLVSIDLSTGEQKQCANLPVATYSPAVTRFNEKEIFFAGGQVFAFYNIEEDSWRTLEIPSHVGPEEMKYLKYDTAFCDIENSVVYLAQVERLELTIIKFKDNECSEIKSPRLWSIGFKSNYSQTILMDDNIVYKFYEYSGESIVEKWKMIKGETPFLLEKSKVENAKFSSSHCMGCFSLCIYDY